MSRCVLASSSIAATTVVGGGGVAYGGPLIGVHTGGGAAGRQPLAVGDHGPGDEHQPRADGRGSLRIARRVLGGAVQGLLDHRLGGRLVAVGQPQHVLAQSAPMWTDEKLEGGGGARLGGADGEARSRRCEQIGVGRRTGGPGWWGGGGGG